MKSKEVLFECLARRFGKTNVVIGNHGIEDETYGPESFIYFFKIRKNWGVNRRTFEDFLESVGFRPEREYWPRSQATEVPVTYFKGTRWDE